MTEDKIRQLSIGLQTKLLSMPAGIDENYFEPLEIEELERVFGADWFAELGF